MKQKRNKQKNWTSFQFRYPIKRVNKLNAELKVKVKAKTETKTSKAVESRFATGKKLKYYL